MHQIARILVNFMMFLACIGTFISKVQAAEVPIGIKLADKQILVRNNYTDPQTLDPTLQKDTYGKNISLDIFEGLVTLGYNGKIRPGVASYWEHNANYTEYTFYLRKNAKWSNGKPVTAHDFVYTWRRLVNKSTDAYYAYYETLAGIKNADAISHGKASADTLGVKAVGDYTLKVYLDNSVPFFVSMTAHPSLSPVYAPAIKQWGNQWTTPTHIISNGAYQLSKHAVNGVTVLNRNPEYWNNKKTVIDEVKFLPIEDSTTAMNYFKSEKLDITLDLPNEYFEMLQIEMPDSVRITPLLASYNYDINTNKPPLNNVKLRKALAYAIDRNVITRYIKQTGSLPAYTLIPPKTFARPDFEPEWATWSQAERNLKAKKLLAETGINPKTIKLTLSYNANDNNGKVATAVQQMWETTLGIQVSLDEKKWKNLIKIRNKGDFDIALESWFGDYNEASTFLSIGLSKNPNNIPKFNSLFFDKAMLAATKAANLEARKKYYTKALKILSKEMPFIPIYYHVMVQLVKPYVGGYNPNIVDYEYTKDMYIIKHEKTENRLTQANAH